MMTTHELAKQLLQCDNVPLLINDEPVIASALEKVITHDGPAVILWTKE